MLDLTKLNKAQRAKLQRMATVDLARDNLVDFTVAVKPEIGFNGFHLNYYKILDVFAKGKIKRLIITMPPQHGKSEGSSRILPSYILGLHPDKKVAITSYSSPFAKKFNRAVQRIIDTPLYREIFPDTRLTDSNVATATDNWLRNSEEFEIVGRKGGLKAVGRKGQLTGDPVDVLIMDDLYKDSSEGNSPITRKFVIDWYIDVANNRLHNDSQQLIDFTRWNEEDLIGWIKDRQDIIIIKR